jgi:hypothetical protein
MKTSLNNLPMIFLGLSLHSKSPTKKNKGKELKLSAESGAEIGVMKVQQEVVPELWQKPITSIQGKIYNYFENNCFRVNDSYAIPVGHYETFMADVQKMIDTHDVLVNALCDAVDSGKIVEEAQRRSKGDFNPALLPKSCGEVKAAYWVDIRHKADLSSPVIAEALSQLAESTRKSVEEKVKADAEKAEAEGQLSVVGFVMDEITAFLKDVSVRCGEGGKRQWKTMLDKFVRITEKLPAYNITGNPAISTAIAKVYQTFKDIDSDALKNDEAYRKAQGETAKTLLADIEGEPLF